MRYALYTTLLGVLLMVGAGLAQERIDLLTPETTPAVTSYRVERLDLNWDGPSVTVYLRGGAGEPKTIVYAGSTATALMVALNKANLSTRSLKQRIFDRLVADGYLAGTVAGSVP